MQSDPSSVPFSPRLGSLHHVAGGSDTCAARGADVREGVRAPREAGGDSGAAAGLVPSKTSPIEISFDKSECRLRRWKRLKSSVWQAAALHQIHQAGHRPSVPWFVTLTYRPGYEWAPHHVADALEAFRRWCKRKSVPCRYVWVAELQQRGAVHYHLLVWLPVGVRMPHWDRTTRASRREVAPFWVMGMSNTQPAKAGVGYLMKYISKLGKYHEFPPGCRTYGAGGLDHDGRQIRAWYRLPMWAKCLVGVGQFSRCPGGVVDLLTGELHRCPYAVLFSKKGLTLTVCGSIPERFHDGPYSIWDTRSPEQ